MIVRAFGRTFRVEGFASKFLRLPAALVPQQVKDSIDHGGDPGTGHG